jgi:choline-sulfatase
MKMINRREFTKLTGSGIAGAVFTPGTIFGKSFNEFPARPNIVFISSDNQSYKDTGFAGHSLIKTPNLDRIAKQGVVFSNAYCGSPVCTPARACMMTGMYPSDNNSFCNATPWDGSYPTWSKLLKENGYYTRSIGKLDLNNNFDTGFEEFESRHNHVNNPDITALFRRPLCFRMGERPNVTGRSRDSIHKDASWAKLGYSFIVEESTALNKPWVLNIGFREPHVAFFERQGFLALKKYWDMYPLDAIDLPDMSTDHLEDQHIVFQSLRHFKRLAAPIPEERMKRARAGYYGMISELDEYIGQIWNALEKTNQLNNTIFIYTSDNGMSMGEHGLFYHNHLYEEAAKVPLVITGASIPKGIEISTPVSHVDVVRTILDITHTKVSANLRGHSLLPLINGEKGSEPVFVYCENHSEGNCTGSFMIRKGDWKYIYFTWYDDLLFNLKEDPNEFTNRIYDPDTFVIQKELKEILLSQVNPDNITMNAFKTQNAILKKMSDELSEEDLFNKFEFRLGSGQARALAAKCKGK